MYGKMYERAGTVEPVLALSPMCDSAASTAYSPNLGRFDSCCFPFQLDDLVNILQTLPPPEALQDAVHLGGRQVRRHLIQSALTEWMMYVL